MTYASVGFVVRPMDTTSLRLPWNMKIDIVWMGMGMDMDGYYGMGVVAILQHV